MSATCLEVCREHYWGHKPLPVKWSWCFQSVWQQVGWRTESAEPNASISAEGSSLAIVGDSHAADQPSPALVEQSEGCSEDKGPGSENTSGVPAAIQYEQADDVIKHFSYKVRGDGFSMFVLNVTSRDSVQAACRQILNIIAPGASQAEASVVLRFRHLERGIMVTICEDHYGLLFSDIVPDRSVLHATVSGEHALRLLKLSSNQVTTTADASSELGTLRIENTMLQWEEARLVRELRGLHMLAETLCKFASSRPEFLKPLAESLEGADATRLLAMNAELRARNLHLEKELNGVEALVHRLSNKGKKHAARKWRGEVVQGTIHSMPPDGSCLFHSVAFGLGAGDSHELRQEVCDFIQSNAKVVVAGRPLQDWVSWETGQTVTDYASAMRDSNKWAGPIEIAVCVFLKRAHIHIYREVKGEGFQRICEFDDVGGQVCSAKVLSVVYSPGHYDAFEVVS